MSTVSVAFGHLKSRVGQADGTERVGTAAEDSLERAANLAGVSRLFEKRTWSFNLLYPWKSVPSIGQIGKRHDLAFIFETVKEECTEGPPCK
jgi:hypothetical protein